MFDSFSDEQRESENLPLNSTGTSRRCRPSRFCCSSVVIQWRDNWWPFENSFARHRPWWKSSAPRTPKETSLRSTPTRKEVVYLGNLVQTEEKLMDLNQFVTSEWSSRGWLILEREKKWFPAWCNRFWSHCLVKFYLRFGKHRLLKRFHWFLVGRVSVDQFKDRG